MIRSFRHKGIEAFFLTSSKACIQTHHAAKRRVLLTALDNARKSGDLNAPDWRFHKLSGDLKGFFSITVNGNWRLIFRFDGNHTELIDYLDYH